MENYGVPEKSQIFWGIEGELWGPRKIADFLGYRGRIKNGK